jgi:hypothetical protein
LASTEAKNLCCNAFHSFDAPDDRPLANAFSRLGLRAPAVAMWASWVVRFAATILRGKLPALARGWFDRYEPGYA